MGPWVVDVQATCIPEPVLVDPNSADGALLSVFYGEPWGDGGGGRRPPFQGKDLSNTPIVAGSVQYSFGVSYDFSFEFPSILPTIS